MNEERSRYDGGKLVLGLAMIALGTFLMLHYYGLVRLDIAWGWWPLILVAMGIGKLVAPREPDDRRGGVWLILVGSWLTINFQGLFGLDWGNSWPLMVIAGGVMIMLGASGRDARRARRARRRAARWSSSPAVPAPPAAGEERS